MSGRVDRACHRAGGGSPHPFGGPPARARTAPPRWKPVRTPVRARSPGPAPRRPPRHSGTPALRRCGGVSEVIPGGPEPPQASSTSRQDRLVPVVGWSSAPRPTPGEQAGQQGRQQAEVRIPKSTNRRRVSTCPGTERRTGRQLTAGARLGPRASPPGLPDMSTRMVGNTGAVEIRSPITVIRDPDRSSCLPRPGVPPALRGHPWASRRPSAGAPPQRGRARPRRHRTISGRRGGSFVRAGCRACRSEISHQHGNRPTGS
ncbi:hypothetical protein UG55_105311 [Frankia sp. EI5c]|nr:hypothetical protein UG55_105311 [Frankia sp. EI5c]